MSKVCSRSDQFYENHDRDALLSPVSGEVYRAYSFLLVGFFPPEQRRKLIFSGRVSAKYPLQFN